MPHCSAWGEMMPILELLPQQCEAQHSSTHSVLGITTSHGKFDSQNCCCAVSSGII